MIHKRSILVALILSAVITVTMFAAPECQAQRAGVQTLTNGLTVATAATNTYLGTSTNVVIPVWEYDNVGVTWLAKGAAAATNGTDVIRVAKSFDGGITFETTPTFVMTYTAPNTPSSGLATNYYGTNLDVKGCTHILVQTVENTAKGTITNDISFNLKSPKFGARQATQ